MSRNTRARGHTLIAPLLPDLQLGVGAEEVLSQLGVPHGLRGHMAAPMWGGHLSQPVPVGTQAKPYCRLSVQSQPYRELTPVRYPHHLCRNLGEVHLCPLILAKKKKKKKKKKNFWPPGRKRYGGFLRQCRR